MKLSCDITTYYKLFFWYRGCLKVNSENNWFDYPFFEVV